jgi:spore cortex biosynthesis protein YabQ
MGIVTYIEQTELAVLFLYSAALGVAFGVFYDVFRILRRAMRGIDRSPVGYAVIFVQDILFFVIAAAVSAIFFYKFNSGRVRLSGVAFMILGFSAYYFTVGRLVMLVADAIISFIAEVLRQIARFLCFVFSPVARFAGFLYCQMQCALRHLLLFVYTKCTLARYNKLLYK